MLFGFFNREASKGAPTALNQASMTMGDANKWLQVKKPELRTILDQNNIKASMIGLAIRDRELKAVIMIDPAQPGPSPEVMIQLKKIASPYPVVFERGKIELLRGDRPTDSSLL
jgi:hypothetical protein